MKNIKISLFASLLLLAMTATHLQAQHFIGENWGGGVVISVSADGQHGLIVAPTLEWSVKQTEWRIANDACENATHGGFTDWRMPTKDELNEIFKNKNIVPNWNNHGHWSSTQLIGHFEGPHYQAWYQIMDSGQQLHDGQWTMRPGNYVRAVRSF